MHDYAPHRRLEPTTETPASLWAALGYFLDCAVRMFGAPLDLAEKAWLSRRDYLTAASWLHRCEELLRKLLFIEALALAPSPLAGALRNSLPSPGRCGASSPGPINADVYEYGPASASECMQAQEFMGPGLAALPRPGNGWAYCNAPLVGEGGPKGRMRGVSAPFDDEHPETWAVSFKLFASQARSPRQRRRGERDPAAVFPALPLAKRFEAVTRAFANRARAAARLACRLAKNPDLQRLFTRPTQSYAQHKTQPGDLAVADAASLAQTAWAQTPLAQTPLAQTPPRDLADADALSLTEAAPAPLPRRDSS